MEQIIQFGRVTRPVLGLTLGPDGALPQLLGPNAPEGVLVLGVAQGGPAERAGILAGASLLTHTHDTFPLDSRLEPRETRAFYILV